MKAIIIILLNSVCPGFLSVAAINKMTKKHLAEERVYFIFQGTVYHPGMPRPELKAGA